MVIINDFTEKAIAVTHIFDHIRELSCKRATGVHSAFLLRNMFHLENINCLTEEHEYALSSRSKHLRWLVRIFPLFLFEILLSLYRIHRKQ